MNRRDPDLDEHGGRKSAWSPGGSRLRDDLGIHDVAGEGVAGNACIEPEREAVVGSPVGKQRLLEARDGSGVILAREGEVERGRNVAGGENVDGRVPPEVRKGELDEG